MVCSALPDAEMAAAVTLRDRYFESRESGAANYIDYEQFDFRRHVWWLRVLPGGSVNRLPAKGNPERVLEVLVHDSWKDNNSFVDVATGGLVFRATGI